MLFLTNLNLNKNELQNAVIQNLSADPSPAKAGQIYYNSVDKVLKQFDGTTWNVVGKEYTGGNGIDVTNQVIKADIDTTAGLKFIGSTEGSKKIGLNIDGTLEFSSGALKVKVPTDNNFSNSLKNKLDDIESGAEVNVIETINVNGTALTPASKVVNIYTITSATFSDDSTSTPASPVKMTLTEGDNDTITANIPKVSSSSAGVVPKGAAVSSQSQTTKFLREDGTWAAPSYTSVSDYVKKDGSTAMTGALNMNSHKITNVTDPTSAQDAATKNYVDSAISGLPTPMQFKGTIGTSGTVEWSALPTAAAANEGYTYKVITAHDTNPICKVGDTIVSNGSTWIIIPSGDEPDGTVTNVATGSGLTGGPITSSGTISLDTAYGDTVNPYGTKDANKVLAGPTSGSAAAPSFRALVAADIPDLSATYQAKGNYKTTQTAVSDPSVNNNATALEFISNITQNTNGVITPTKKKVAYDTSVTQSSENLVTSGAVYTAIQEVTGGAVKKKTVTNPALTAAGGTFTWSIVANAALGTGEITVNVYEVSSGAIVIPEVVVNQSTGAITITINDTNGLGNLSAGTYKAVLIG